MTTPKNNPLRSVTIDEIATVASGEAGPSLEARVQEAATRDTRVAQTLTTFLRIVDAMDGDVLNEPPTEALAQAKALGRQLVSRRATSRSPLAVFGEMFDRAGAVVVEWLNPDSGLALAGVRDDRGADVLEATVEQAEITIRAERTPAQDGVLRLVGEVISNDDTPVKASLAVLDVNGVVLSTDTTDSLGMFAIELPAESSEIVVSARSADGTVHPTIVLPLGPGGSA
jgi:hypothetical protein